MEEMTSKILFHERMQDINEYFSFIQLLINKRPSLIYRESQNNEPTTIPVDMDMTHILKANAFIILYNLIEATISNAIEDIHNVFISNEALCVDTINENLTKVAFQSLHTPNGQIDFSQGNIAKVILKEWLSAHKRLIEANKNPLFSGNVDAKKIREVAEKYGFSSDTNAEITRNGYNLLPIKKARNDLAHGSESFRNKGRDTSIDTLVEMKDEVFHYLNCILENIQTYLDTQSYLRAAG
ncbi:MAE_28990/MAE_18760 family HEPN-like nuclease [Klebsiella michiganensis]|uniref:MAE_28990/MAE_18760 family HEPN-like nuclease n=1 Tax=Klebsiella TaxID=570 RepID=UPI001868ED9F|nr:MULTISPECIES: MAE_28990/MAE_18760 family HEPN-like nuclease [Klebsiella]MCX3080531.1 MAE_28990/MAE_18760 family HEPN-like nuclease [Klebsiella michiganensis]MCY0820839.1 MAE_28990/MAE_18760 family HEPN-like nuclease [Klebsiella michiganensis]